MATLTREVRLIMTENGLDPKTGKPLNNNKYWNAKAFDDGTWSAEWGRVGCETPDSGAWDESKKTLDSVVRSKIKKGYTEQKTIGEAVVSASSDAPVKNTDLHAIAKAQILTTSSPVLDRLIKRFVDANVHKITSSTQITYNSTTGLFTTPLGIVEQSGLVAARDLLANLAPFVKNHKFGPDADKILCQYLRIIPQSLGMKRFSTETVIPDDNALQRQLDLVDSLESSYQAMVSAPIAKVAGVKPQESARL
jgi:poly [ADP-ribose] polymerase